MHAKITKMGEILQENPLLFHPAPGNSLFDSCVV